MPRARRSTLKNQDCVFKKSLLKSQLTVVTEHHSQSKTVSVGFFVALGSRDEPRGAEGAAHFLEHMVFKGTKKRSAFEIAKALEAVGGELNAFTSREYTCFHSATLAEDLSMSLDVVSDLVIRPLLLQKDLEKERLVILQEMEMTKENFEELLFDEYFARVYPNSSLGRPILGFKGSIEKMTAKRLNAYHRSRYVGAHIVVAVAGQVDHKLVVNKLSSEIKGQSPIATARIRPKYHSFCDFLLKPSEQVHLLVGFPSVAFDSPLRFASYIVNAALGGGMTSRLYQRVREDEGLVYAINSSLCSFTDSGVFTIYAGTSQDSLPKLLKILGEELRRLQKDGISEMELEFFKKQIRGSILIGADDVENRMNSLGVNEMVFGRYRSVDSVLSEIAKITMRQVNEYIASTFVADKVSLLGLGSEKSNKKMLMNWRW